jgi:hypothetical protein
MGNVVGVGYLTAQRPSLLGVSIASGGSLHASDHSEEDGTS